MTVKLVKIEPSSRSEKKYQAIFEEDGRTRKVHFGAKGYDDFTLTNDITQRDLYRKRHQKDLKGDPTKPGYLSYYILWNKPTLSASISDYKRRFNL